MTAATHFRRWFARPWHPSLHTRLALMSAAAVAIAIAVVCTLAYWSTEQSLRAQMDRAFAPARLADGFPGAAPPGTGFAQIDPEELCAATASVTAASRFLTGWVQLVRADGTSCHSSNPTSTLSVTAADVAVARTRTASLPRDATTSRGVHVRVVTVPLAPGYALMIARDLTATDNTLRKLSLVLFGAGGLGTLGALLAGLLVARGGLRPLEKLTRAAEQVAATTDLNVPIEIAGHDEVARLATAFNNMTAALEAGRQRQHQLVADAGHEIRTPLTSLRTNVELLLRSEQAARPLPGPDRRELLRSLSDQLQELTQLANELSLLSHDEPATEAIDVRLDDVARRAVQRASRRGQARIITDLHPWTVSGDPVALERAVLNVLDNAVKFSPPASTVRVRLREGLLQIEDEGPGIPAEQRQHVFERFWRSPSSRSMPGSGLGLAIVADVVTGHGGQVEVDEAATGGAVIFLQFPGQAAGADSNRPSPLL
jgi:two-component system sensor histidine kinase MprB